MSLHMKGAQDVQCRFIVSGAGAQKVEYARLYRKMAAILTLQMFCVKLLSLSPSFPASYGGACFKSQHFAGRGWKDQGFYASLGYTLGSRPSWNLLTLSLTYVFIWGHTLLVLLFEYATSHTSSRVKDLFLQDGLLSGDWLLRAIFMNVWMCWWVILWTLLGDGGNSRGGCEDIACRLYFALSYCCSTLLPVGCEVYVLTGVFCFYSVSTWARNMKPCDHLLNPLKTMSQNTSLIIYLCFLQIFWPQAHQSNKYIWSQREKRGKGMCQGTKQRDSVFSLGIDNFKRI